MELRDQIIEQSSKLFRAYGIRSNTMDDIAREVGISKKTLYLHIKDKNELIDLVIAHEYKKFEKRIKNIKAISNDPIEHLIRLNIVLANLLKSINPASVNDLYKNYRKVYDAAQEKYQLFIFKEIIENIKKGKQTLIYREDINEEIITKLHADRFQTISETKDNWLELQESSETIKEMTIYYIRGLLNDKGQSLLDGYINNFEKYLD